MTGDDVKKLFDNLQLNVKAAAVLLGIKPAEFHTMVGYMNRQFDLGLPIGQLSLDILGHLWRRVEQTYDTSTDQGREAARQYGSILAKALHTHGAAYAVWLVIDDRCSGVFQEELRTIEEVAPRL